MLRAALIIVGVAIQCPCIAVLDDIAEMQGDEAMATSLQQHKADLKLTRRLTSEVEKRANIRRCFEYILLSRVCITCQDCPLDGGYGIMSDKVCPFHQVRQRQFLVVSDS